MEVKFCYICNGGVTDADIYMSVGKTNNSHATFPTKISQLIGDDFLVVVSEDDQLCKRCADLINKYDKLEVDLLETKYIITGLLSEKYCLGSAGALQHAPEEGVKNSKGKCDSEGENVLDESAAMENYSSIGENEDSSLLSNGADNLYDRKSKIPYSLSQELKCTTVKCETFRDCSTDLICSTTQKTNLNNSLNNDSTNHQDLLNQFSGKDVCKQSTPLPSCKLKHPTLTYQDDQHLKEVKKEKDVFDSNTSDVPYDTEPMKTVDEKEMLKFECASDFFKYFDCSLINTKSNNDELTLKSSLPHSEMLINEFNPKIDLLNNKKRTDLNVSLKKTKHVAKPKFKTSLGKPPLVKKLRPILPKFSSLDLKALFFNNKSQTESVLNGGTQTKFINKNLEKNQINPGKTFVKEDPSHEKEADSVLISDIKIEVIHNKSPDYSCKLCKADFDSEDTLKTHLRKHSTNEQCYSCGFCSKTFKWKHGLENHTATYHTKKFKFCCEKCGKGFARKCNLDDHRKGYKEKESVCEICGKKFNSRGTLWIHRKWHSDPLPYQCKECGKLFKHSSLLSVHKRKQHTGERPYKCSYCSLTFNIKSSLNLHLMMHTKNYPYNCTTCKRGFTTRCKYRVHMEKVHTVIIEKQIIEKKDYKVAVYDEDDTRNDGSVRTDLGSENVLGTLACDLTDFDETQNLSTDNNLKNTVEIVLTTSNVLSDEQIITIPDDWLT